MTEKRFLHHLKKTPYGGGGFLEGGECERGFVSVGKNRNVGTSLDFLWKLILEAEREVFG